MTDHPKRFSGLIKPKPKGRQMEQFFKTEFNHDRDAESLRLGLECKDPTRAQQQFKDECDINVLFGRYLETGEMPQVLDGLSYGNFEGIFDFQTAMNSVRLAQEQFATLPARIKNRFDNDPQKLIAFLDDPENREEAEFLGLTNKRKENHESGSSTPTQGSTQNQTPAPRTPNGETTAQGTEKPGSEAGKTD